MDTALATEVLKEALERPEIFNSDQGSQSPNQEHTELLKDQGITISMNGKGRSINNIAIERFFRTFKCEEVYINDCQNIAGLRAGIARYMDFYNFNRFHSVRGYKKPMEVYRTTRLKVA